MRKQFTVLFFLCAMIGAVVLTWSPAAHALSGEIKTPGVILPGVVGPMYEAEDLSGLSPQEKQELVDKFREFLSIIFPGTIVESREPATLPASKKDLLYLEGELDEALPFVRAKATEIDEQEAPALEPEQPEEERVPAAPHSDGFHAYSVAGQTPNVEWQRYLYDQLAARGYEWYFPYAVCQIWQESRWNPNSTNGRDHGLTQQKGIYWESRCANMGIPGADIWDPYAQLYVFSYMMTGYLAATGGNVEMALSWYFLGTGEYSEVYVGHVTSWLPTLVKR